VAPLASNGASTARRSGKTRVGIDFEHAQGGIRAGSDTCLPDRLAQAGRARCGGILQQVALVARGRAEALDREPQHLGRGGHHCQPGSEREPHPDRIGERLAEGDLLAPGTTLLDQHG